ncbi:hypothetical protein [Streptomyces rubradiris]|uniref:Uncharacterized protein n=1 Tax=Streptomyces rubradiris TaxID=285531 RepID=A0ABQ3R3I9_STRRR|nr:hypothetical protein [Streptomyces rubradiris]GHH30126.1 hypothetical protein GCM10018792_76180 [Streptomyces rubradiris]GHI50399.1 hypothetical protein Srubr_02450 [Streptomyces rubradiris]
MDELAKWRDEVSRLRKLLHEVSEFLYSDPSPEGMRLHHETHEAFKRTSTMLMGDETPMKDVSWMPTAPGCENWRREHRADVCPMGTCQRCRYLERFGS